jgi:sialidase-1
MKRIFSGLLFAVCGFTFAAEPFFEESDIWRHNKEGDGNYQVFGLVQSTKGTLLAFAEGRVGGGRDADPHHLVMKRSTDGGRTWLERQYIEKSDGSFWEKNGQPGKREAWAQSAPVVDEKTGRIFFFYALNEGSKDQNFTRAFYRYSDDDGLTWQPTAKDGHRIEVTQLFADNPHGWTFHMPGPGHGIQLRQQQGKHADKNGRLIVPVWHRRAVTANPRLYGVSLLASDDHGKSWRHTGDAGIGHGMNESRLVELADGRLLLNARGGAGERDGQPFDTGANRVYAWSEDAGETFGTPVVRTEFVFHGNGVDSSLVRYPDAAEPGKNLLLFSRPAAPNKRGRMTVSLSEDEGRTWPHHKLINPGASGYSDLIVLPDRTIGLLHNQGARVAFSRFNLEWLKQP